MIPEPDTKLCRLRCKRSTDATAATAKLGCSAQGHQQATHSVAVFSRLSSTRSNYSPAAQSQRRQRQAEAAPAHIDGRWTRRLWWWRMEAGIHSMTPSSMCHKGIEQTSRCWQPSLPGARELESICVLRRQGLSRANLRVHWHRVRPGGRRSAPSGSAAADAECPSPTTPQVAVHLPGRCSSSEKLEPSRRAHGFPACTWHSSV